MTTYFYLIGYLTNDGFGVGWIGSGYWGMVGQWGVVGWSNNFGNWSVWGSISWGNNFSDGWGNSFDTS